MAVISYVFEHKVLHCPVTALTFVDKLLVTGEGPFVHIYDTESNLKKYSYKVFEDAVIHGIRISNFNSENKRLICVFGSKKLKLLCIDVSMFVISSVTETIELDDWIWDIKWLHGTEVTEEITDHGDTSSNETHSTCDRLNNRETDLRRYITSISLAAVMGHNSVRHLQFEGNGKCIEEINIIDCEEKCILYCALCIGCCWKDLVVASGTVFNQIVLWKPSGELNVEGKSTVIHRLKGHEGVIFSIDYNFDKQLISSVSDDRSIRLWKIGEAETSITKSCPQSLMLDKIEIAEDKVLYGHTARVWDVSLLKNYIISIGEDATCCVWNYNGEVALKYKGHKGKSIWSLAVNEDESLMATGGGDCSVRLWSVSKENLPKSLPRRTDVLHIPQTEEDDFPRSVALIAPNVILTMTNEGILWMHNLQTNDWSKVLEDSDFSSYSLLSCTPFSDVYALGNIHGKIKILTLTKGSCIDQKLYDGKILSILWLNNGNGQPSDSKTPCSLLLTTGPEGNIDVWEVDLNSNTLSNRYNFNLPYTKQRWVSASLILPKNNLIICGDRGGTVHGYTLDGQSKEPVQSYWKLHGKTGVTDFCFNSEQVYSCGRDGHFRMYTAEEGKLQLLSSHKVYKGFEWIAKLCVLNDDVLAIGFHTDQFVVYSTSTNQKLVSIPCGGGHRTWDFLCEMYFRNNAVGHVGNTDYSFVYIKNRDVVICEGQVNANHTILKNSLHGRELCNVKHLFSVQDTEIIVTSSEDTDVAILAIKSSASDPDCSTQILACLQGHLSSVRALTVSHGNLLLTEDDQSNNRTVISKLLFSGGGRAEIKVWKIYCEITDSCDRNRSIVQQEYEQQFATSKRSNCDNFHCWHEYLSGHCLTDKMKIGYKPWTKKDYDPDPETRYMDLTSFTVGEVFQELDIQGENLTVSLKDLHILVAACSDGFVRVLAFNAMRKHFQVLAECNYHDHCVLKVNHLILPNNCTTTSSLACDTLNNPPNTKSNKIVNKKGLENGNNVYVISAATDGKFAIWNITAVVKAYMRLQMLTSGGSTPLNCDTRDGIKDQFLESLDLGEVLDLSVPVLTVEVHQSGVNAVNVWHVSGNELVIATGGDDNATVVTRMRRTLHQNGDDYEDTFTVMEQNKCLFSHAGGVTGIRWIDSDTLLTVSIDQRLILWHIAKDLAMKMKSCMFINVADVCNMDVWVNSKSLHNISLCGVGLQILNLHQEITNGNRNK